MGTCYIQGRGRESVHGLEYKCQYFTRDLTDLCQHCTHYGPRESGGILQTNLLRGVK